MFVVVLLTNKVISIDRNRSICRFSGVEILICGETANSSGKRPLRPRTVEKHKYLNFASNLVSRSTRKQPRNMNRSKRSKMVKVETRLGLNWIFWFHWWIQWKSAGNSKKRLKIGKIRRKISYSIKNLTFSLEKQNSRWHFY